MDRVKNGEIVRKFIIDCFNGGGSWGREMKIYGSAGKPSVRESYAMMEIMNDINNGMGSLRKYRYIHADIIKIIWNHENRQMLKGISAISDAEQLLLPSRNPGQPLLSTLRALMTSQPLGRCAKSRRDCAVPCQ